MGRCRNEGQLHRDADGLTVSIHIKPSHVGLLHKHLNVAPGHPIPHDRLVKAEHSSNPAIRKEATFAVNASHWDHKHKGT